MDILVQGNNRHTRIRVSFLTFAITLSWLMTMPLFGYAQQQSDYPSLILINRTDATVRVERIDDAGVLGEDIVTLKPGATKSMRMLVGRHKFDLVAFRARPVHVHRIELEFETGKSTTFHFSAHNIGRYLLEDANSLLAIPIFPSVAGKSNATTKVSAPNYSDGICKPAINDVFAVTLWDPAELHPPRHFRSRGEYLCSSDGYEVFHKGATFENISCEYKWTNCRRQPELDALLDPVIYTSQVPDLALANARRNDPAATWVETQVFKWTAAEHAPWRLSKYNSYRVTKSNLECSKGYRFHYQRFCINIEDELKDHPQESVRTVEPFSGSGE